MTAGLAIGAQFLWYRYAKPVYASDSRMIVSVKLSIPDAQAYSEELENFYGTQIALMKSDSIKDQVEESLDARAATNSDLEYCKVKLSASVSPKTSIFDLEATGVNPAYVQAYLQSLMEDYISLKRNLLENAANSSKSGMENEIMAVRTELNQSQQELIHYQASNSVVLFSPDGENNAAAYLAELNRQLTADQSELNLLKTLTLDENLERKQSGVGSTTANAGGDSANSTPGGSGTGQYDAGSGNTSGHSYTGISSMGGANGSASMDQFEQQYLEAKKQILLLKAQRDELGENLRPAHPKMVALTKEIDEQERLLEIFRSQSVEHLDDTRHTLEVQIQNLQASIKVWEAKALDMSTKLAGYEAIKSKIAREQTMYDQLAAAMQTLNVGESVGQESVSVLEPACEAYPVAPRKLMHYAFALIAGLIAGIGLLMLINRLDDRMISYHEAADLFDEPILGQIPLLKVKSKDEGEVILQPEDERFALAEAFRNLRSSLVFMDSPKSPPKSIAITSAIPDEGKSTTAANLAITLARTGARVLLIDADLRRGVMHKHFATDQVPGLSEVLGGKCGWNSAVAGTNIPNLHLLPCGTPARNSGELLAGKVTEFLNNIAGKYDYYIFDTAPIMAADDVSNLAPHVDGLLLVVRAEYTSSRVVQAVIKLLYMRKVNVLGMVLNGVRPDAGKFGYKYKEYYSVNSVN